MKNIKNYVGVVTIADPNDKMSWSGLNYKILTAIKDNFENVATLGPLKGYGINKVLAILNKLSFIIFKRRYNYTHSYLLSLVYSAQLNRKLKKISKCDTLIFIGSSSALSFLKFDGKVIYLTDATVNSLIDYYFFNLWRFSINESNYIEQKALRNSDAIFFSSEWAKKDADNFYDIKHADRRIIKFGPNLNDLYIPKKNTIRDVGVKLPFNLLFVGVDWERKGGEILLENYLSLLDKGYTNLSLTICGCVPPQKMDFKSKNIIIYPYLNKNKSKDLMLLQEIFRNSHVFVLPTRAECSAVVYSEAAAYSLPILTFDTGGTTSYIQDSVNGYTIKPEDKYAFGDKILELMLDQDKYLEFSAASFKKYNAEMNWNNYSEKIRLFIEERV